MATTCPKCGSKKIDKKALNIEKYDSVVYVDVKLSCNDCGHSEIRKLTKSSVKKLEDEPGIDIKPLVTAAEAPYISPEEEIILPRKRGSKMFGYIKLALFYLVALLIGIFVEVIGIFVERTMMMLEFPAVIGFTISLSFFVLAPILAVGAFVNFFRKKPFEGFFIGALAIPVTLIFIYYSRRFQWNYLEQLYEIYDSLLAL